MFTEDYQEKTEPASPRKKEEARRGGYVPLSLELNSALSFLALFSVLALLFSPLTTQLKEIFQHSLNKIAVPDLSFQSFYSLFSFGLTSFFKIILPLLLFPLVIAIFSGFLQTNFLLTIKPLLPADERSGFSGNTSGLAFRLSRVFSKRSLFEGIKFSLKIAVLFLLGYLLIKDELPSLVTLADREVEELLFYLSSILFKFGIWLVLVFILFGLGDLLFQRWQYEKEMRMSREELKREQREEEGSPETKSWLKGFMEKEINEK